MPIEEQLDAFGRVLDAGKVFPVRLEVQPICLKFLIAILVRLQVRPMYSKFLIT